MWTIKCQPVSFRLSAYLDKLHLHNIEQHHFVFAESRYENHQRHALCFATMFTSSSDVTWCRQTASMHSNRRTLNKSQFFDFTWAFLTTFFWREWWLFNKNELVLMIFFFCDLKSSFKKATSKKEDGSGFFWGAITWRVGNESLNLNEYSSRNSIHSTVTFLQLKLQLICRTTQSFCTKFF